MLHARSHFVQVEKKTEVNSGFTLTSVWLSLFLRSLQRFARTIGRQSINNRKVILLNSKSPTPKKKNCQLKKIDGWSRACMEKKPPDPIWIKFCKVEGIPDVITYANFGNDRLRLTGNRQSRALFTWQKTKLPQGLPLSLLRGSRPNVSGPAPNNILVFPQISSKSVHFRRSYSRTREHRWNAPQSISNNRRSCFAE